MSSEIKPFYPVYCRSPNKLVRYEDRPFYDGHGHSGVVTVAIFNDKNGNIQEMDAFVKWNQK